MTPPGPGSWNMALDEALAGSVRDGGLPFLRFYGWSPQTLSLGRFQNPDAGLTQASRQVPRVRRTTGGGAIWHGAELTYSLGCRQDDLSVRGVKPSFELLCGFLLDTWVSLGWEACFAKDIQGGRGSQGSYTPACFAGREEYDIMVNGRKLGGNAQRRDRDSLFQHGSLPFKLDWEMLETLFVPGFRPDRGEVTDLENCGWTGSAEDLTGRLTAAFGARLGAELVGSAPEPAEQEKAGCLEQEKFGSAHWTETAGGAVRAP